MALIDHLNYLLKEEWNYNRALIIYKQHSSTTFLAPILSQGEVGINTDLLKKEIQQLLEREESQSQIPYSKKEEVQLPDAVKTIEEEKNKLFKRNAALKMHLYNLYKQGKKDELKDACVEILQNFDRIYECWDDLDYYHTYGHLPEKEEPEEEIEINFEGLDRARLNEQSNRYREYVSRYSRKIKAVESELENTKEEEHQKKEKLYQKLSKYKDFLKKYTNLRDQFSKYLNK